jgi:hypothetical protein
VEQTISIIVPVHNVQHVLKERIAALIDIVSDLTTRFEICIVDDASTDTTWELSEDLAREYPQVRVVHDSRRRGLARAAEEEIRKCKATTVLVHNIHEPLGVAALSDLCFDRPNRLVDQQRIAERIDLSHQAGSFRLITRRNMKADTNSSSIPPGWLDIAPDMLDRVPLS